MFLTLYIWLLYHIDNEFCATFYSRGPKKSYEWIGFDPRTTGYRSLLHIYIIRVFIEASQQTFMGTRYWYFDQKICVSNKKYIIRFSS